MEEEEEHGEGRGMWGPKAAPEKAGGGGEEGDPDGRPERPCGAAWHRGGQESMRPATVVATTEEPPAPRRTTMQGTSAHATRPLYWKGCASDLAPAAPAADDAAKIRATPRRWVRLAHAVGRPRAEVGRARAHRAGVHACCLEAPPARCAMPHGLPCPAPAAAVCATALPWPRGGRGCIRKTYCGIRRRLRAPIRSACCCRPSQRNASPGIEQPGPASEDRAGPRCRRCCCSLVLLLVMLLLLLLCFSKSPGRLGAPGLTSLGALLGGFDPCARGVEPAPSGARPRAAGFGSR